MTSRTAAGTADLGGSASTRRTRASGFADAVGVEEKRRRERFTRIEEQS